MKLGGRYDVSSEVDGMRAPLHGLEFHVDDAVEFPQFRRLVAVDLVDVHRLPVWLVGASKTGVFSVFTADKDSEAVFQEIMVCCDFELGEIVGLLLETDQSQRYVVLYPRLEEDHVEIKGVVLDLDNDYRVAASATGKQRSGHLSGETQQPAAAGAPACAGAARAQRGGKIQQDGGAAGRARGAPSGAAVAAEQGRVQRAVRDRTEVGAVSVPTAAPPAAGARRGQAGQRCAQHDPATSGGAIDYDSSIRANTTSGH
ncbi:hypothetical protein KL943_002237 [Ogataea angusta]|nr:hypothetical protein KL943_002237 [Ogataea angusta]